MVVVVVLVVIEVVVVLVVVILTVVHLSLIQYADHADHQSKAISQALYFVLAVAQIEPFRMATLTHTGESL